MNITVAIFIDRYGDATIRAFTTPELAEDWRQEIAVSWWTQDIGDTEAEPNTRAARADRYFEIMGERRGAEFSVETVPLESPVTPEPATKAAYAHLQAARDQLKLAGATRAVDRVRLALTSCGGAVRHARGKASRTEA